MAIEFNDLCRLCATKDESSKDLKDENNRNVLDMIQELLQIAINEDDKLPTKVCLSCEEKLVSYQLFIFECYQVQATLNKMFSEKIPHYPVKNEELAVVNAAETEVKIERDEQTAEDLENTINNQEISEFDGDDFIKSDHDQESDGDLSDVNLATLKKIKLKKTKQNVISEENQMQLKEVLMNSNCTVKDFVKMQCKICDKIVRPFNALRLHYAKVHKSEPSVSCICGFVIRSHSVLYKHVADHRVESRKYKKVTESDPEQDKYEHLKVRNFVRFACNICEKQFHSWYRLKSHCEREHKIKPVAQCVCGVTLKSKSVLYKHVKDHKNPDVICCDKCPRITKSVAAMNKHKMRHVPKSERKFYCQTCNKIFTSKDTLKSHERSHIPVEERKIYECDICHLKFTTRCSATSHKRVVHDKIKSYVCDLCGYACGTGGELRQHRAIHSDDKPFVCNKCSKPFKTYSNLKTHMDTHEDTSYTCYVCSRVLNSRRTLKKHLLVHEDKCRYVCSYCNKAFKRRQTLKVHMYTHTGDKPLSCKWCEERFAYASTLRSHRLRFHPEKMPLHYNTYNAHIAMQQGYLKPDPAAVGVPNVGKNDVEAI